MFLIYQTRVKTEEDIKLKQVPPNLHLGTKFAASATKSIIQLCNTKILVWMRAMQSEKQVLVLVLYKPALKENTQ